jgi:hypothetical protein
MAETCRKTTWAADSYRSARARDCSHPQATRILGSAWCGVIWRIWHDHTTYDPNRHTAHQQLRATQA